MRLLCIGDNVVDRYVGQGVMYPGGNAVNVAVFAKRLGADSAYQGIVGSDEAGRLVLGSLLDEGVDTSRVSVADGPNAWADVDLVEGDRRFLGSDKGVSLFALVAQHYADARGFDVVHTAYTARLDDQLGELCAHALRVSYDFGRNFTAEQVSRLASGLWLASFSGSHLSEAAVSDLLRAACGAGATYALVTRGPQGAALATHDQRWDQAAGRVPVIDTLGAGDAFIAALLVRLSRADDPASALADASEVAQGVITRSGAFGHGAPFSRRAAVLEGEI
ncbi:PfkB family carbohydrate kinase [Propioniciclava tarda]|uniref:Carbohydrate kinase PfkB domain-containing protein n=1 Tax=Propioniciclava tarda TaxID=433330 RepID=A0A4Q9KPZ6_PROTD|nr:PfkB family carbohydrate kinase [Propioniciclava tarda]TBT96425.1 hypothetical protein ET996_01900 [Propioniciclava tarda]SMO37977.1 fructoselysine 6-kinase [Propioniciclava tarda]